MMSGSRAFGIALLTFALVGCSGLAGKAPTFGGPRTAPTAVADPSANDGSQTNPSVVPADLGPTPGDEAVNFSVSLQLPGQAALDAYLSGLTQPGSGSYHQYLTRG